MEEIDRLEEEYFNRKPKLIMDFSGTSSLEYQKKNISFAIEEEVPEEDVNDEIQVPEEDNKTTVIINNSLINNDFGNSLL